MNKTITCDSNPEVLRLNTFYFLSWFCIDSSDAGSSPAVRGGLFRGARDPQASGTCMSWGGTHYRTFDRKHFHFQGSCTYLLASSTDGTWAVYMSTECDAAGHCRRVQTHTRHEFIFMHLCIFSRRVYPKRLTIAFGLYICFFSTCVSWESNPQPFALLTQCSTTEPQEHTPVLYVYRSQRELKMDHIFFPNTSFWFYCTSFVYSKDCSILKIILS